MLIKFARHAARRIWHSGRNRVAGRTRGRRLGVESLEGRELLAADLAVSELISDGEDLIVKYAVNNQNANPFTVGLYQSADGVSADALLQTERVSDPADYAQGTGHALTISPDFSDSSEDYYVLAVLDIYFEVYEANESNNNQVYSGGVFVTDDDVVHIHGGDSSDSVTVDGGSIVDITVNGALTSFAPSAVSAIHVRAHGGDDQVDALDAKLIPIWAFGGSGDDTLIGGRGADLLYGGDDDDVMLGRAGSDALYGESGHDEIGGGTGNDSIYGDDGADMLHGDAGQDHIEGGNDSDVIYGGDGADDIYAGSGDDFVFATSADSVSLGPGNDTQYEDEDGNGYGSAYGNRPVISQFAAIQSGSMWTITGLVSDEEDDPTGWTITIGGIVAETVSVAYNDTFTLGVSIPDEEFGWISAQVTDPDGNESEIVWFRII